MSVADQVLLGLDIGGSSIKAALVDVTRGLAALQVSSKRSLGLIVKTAKAFIGRNATLAKSGKGPQA